MWISGSQEEFAELLSQFIILCSVKLENVELELIREMKKRVMQWSLCSFFLFNNCA